MKGKTMKAERPKVWYPAHSGAAGTTQIDKEAEAHILWKGVLLCRKSIPDIMEAAKCDKWVIREGVIPGYVVMCQECQEKYKSNHEFPWANYIDKVIQK
jgi:hypothetical protein